MPILAPALVPLGIDPVHFAIVFTHNMEIALVHPPSASISMCSRPSRTRRCSRSSRASCPSSCSCCWCSASSPMSRLLSLWLPNLVYG
ncbi:MAG: TRAP transporter large permease subunit [Pseudomonadota bacterium]